MLWKIQLEDIHGDIIGWINLNQKVNILTRNEDEASLYPDTVWSKIKIPGPNISIENAEKKTWTVIIAEEVKKILTETEPTLNNYAIIWIQHTVSKDKND